jgi:DNA-binding transcriptional regulator YiaG
MTVTTPIEWTPKRIKALRKRTRHTQQTLADLIDVRRVTIANWETDFKKPSAKHQAVLDGIASSAGLTSRSLDRG